MPVCPVCNTFVSDDSYLETHTWTFKNFRKDYKLYRCPSCDLDYWEPREVIREFYEREAEAGYKLLHAGFGRIEFWHKPFFKIFPLKKGRLLDIGCGDGTFLLKARSSGFDVWGVDLDSKSIEMAKRRGLNQAFNMTLDEFVDYAKGKGWSFDVITFFEVLEHQDNPKRFLTNVRHLLKPGGWIAGSIPNRDRFSRKYDDRETCFDHPPHHLLRFSKNTLKNLLEVTGYTSIEQRDVKDILELTRLIEVGIACKLGLWNTRKQFIEDTLKLDIEIHVIVKKQKIFLPSFYLFKILQAMRNFLLLPTVFVLYPFIEGHGIYFQARIR